MNPIQQAAFTHLTQPGHPERVLAHQDLTEDGFFDSARSEQTCKTIVAEYISRNPRKFCAPGLRRLQEALQPKPPTKRVARMTFDLLIEGPVRDDATAVDLGPTTDLIARRVVGQRYMTTGNTADRTILGLTAVDARWLGEAYR